MANRFTFRRIMDEEPANNYYSLSDIVLPQLAYGLVDTEEIIQAIYKDDSRYPVLLRVRGLDKGRLYILTIPENQSDLYQLPPEVLSQIRRDLMREIPVYLDSPSQICLFTYDNNTFVTRSYQPGPVRYKIVVKKASAKLFDLQTRRAVARICGRRHDRSSKSCKCRARMRRTGSSSGGAAAFSRRALRRNMRPV